MPPVNTARRERLADAAIELLAGEGSRGLTHRAVDALAGEPAGTTSRYFRTREALMRGVVERIRALHFADLAGAVGGTPAGTARAAPAGAVGGTPAGTARAAPGGAIDPDLIAAHLGGVIHDALTLNRPRHLAMCELFLESTRRPDLRDALTETRTAQIALIRDIHLAAGVALDDRQAALLVSTITGLLFIAITTPAAIGVHSPDDVRALVEETVRAAARTTHAR
jgi:AcrR family transcriptional regulator